MYTNVRETPNDAAMQPSPSLAGLLSHTALAGHAVLVGGGHRLNRLAPALRSDRLMVSDVVELSDIDSFMLVSHKTMLIVDVTSPDKRRICARLARSYPDILVVGIVDTAKASHDLRDNLFAVEATREDLGGAVLAVWQMWRAQTEGLLECWLGCLEAVMPFYSDGCRGAEDLATIGCKLGLEEVHLLEMENEASWFRNRVSDGRQLSVRAPAYRLTTPMSVIDEQISLFLSADRSLGMKTILLMPIEVHRETRGFLVAIAPRDFRWTADVCAQLSVVGQARAYHEMNPDGESLDVIVELLVHILSGKDGYTAQHSDRVAILAREIALEMCLPASSIELSYLGGRLHDIGKLWVDGHFLTKAGPLTPTEYEALKSHTTAGYDLLDRFERLRMLKNVVLCHHERMDGLGYPQGLTGDKIPLIARIVSVADAYDAMTTDRSYRRGRPSSEALDELNRCAGKQFDSEIVTAFNQVFSRLESPTFEHRL